MSYLEFCKKYKEKIKLESLEENKEGYYNIHPEYITFSLNMMHGFGMTIGNIGVNLFTLDKEDLEYLSNKYSKKLVEEMQIEIERVKGNYDNA